MKITEVTPQKNNPSRVNVFADGEYVFSLDDVDALVLGIKPGREITQADLKNCLFESQFGKAKAKAMDILSRKSVSSAMLCAELQKKDYDPAVISEVIREFEELGYIDDFNFAMLYLEYASSKLWGEKKIRYELSQKGVSNHITEDALSSFSLPGAAEVAQCIKQKYPGEDLKDFKVKQKIMRFFASRGFEFSLVEEAIRVAAEADTTG